MYEINAKDKYMQMAIEEAIEGITKGHGGPFGCVIVKKGEVIGRGHNRVLANNDPTCHGEVDAIREACKNISSFDLEGSVLYTTGEPCPMCLFACMWANIKTVYYGCSLEDNSRIGFRDSKFDEILTDRSGTGIEFKCIDRDACLKLFELYKEIGGVKY